MLLQHALEVLLLVPEEEEEGEDAIVEDMIANLTKFQMFWRRHAEFNGITYQSSTNRCLIKVAKHLGIA